ncbi:MAG: TetR/AcrR family transcriptional regulator [Ornithinimicrobium sp.]
MTDLAHSTHETAGVQDDLDRAVVDAAVEIVDDLGVAGLTNRRLADRAGTTTMTIYSRFGSKDGVARALFNRGFELLGARLDAHAPTSDNPEMLVDFCSTYRDFGLERPGLYSIMFERAMPLGAGFTSGPGSRVFGALCDRVATVLGLDITDARVPTETFGLWALCHGLVNLELTGTKVMENSATGALFRLAIATHTAGLTARRLSESENRP